MEPDMDLEKLLEKGWPDTKAFLSYLEKGDTGSAKTYYENSNIKDILATEVWFYTHSLPEEERKKFIEEWQVYPEVKEAFEIERVVAATLRDAWENPPDELDEETYRHMYENMMEKMIKAGLTPLPPYEERKK